MVSLLKHKISDFLNHLIYRLHINENTLLLITASIVGIVGGFGAVGFRTLILFIQRFAIGDQGNIEAIVRGLPVLRKVFLPSIGGLIIGPLIYYLGRETKGHGVPEVMEAVALRGGKIRSRVMFLKAFVSAMTIGTGGSVGREGPIVQIGSSLGSTFGQLLNVSPERLKVLVASGSAAGIASTFNSPIAGVLFAVEIILGNYAITTLVPLILSSVLATIVGRWYFGDIPAFEIPHYHLAGAWEIGPYILLGLFSGIVAVVFVKVLYALEDTADKLPIKAWIKTPLILFLIGVGIVYFPQIYGVGYDTISQVLKGEMAWTLLLFLVPVKMLATSITLAAGGSGGIFAPSLFIGAVFGGLFGAVLQLVLPANFPISSGAYAVVGMSAMVAGTTHAPLTAFLVIFEMTGDYKLILPLMLCSILASFVASMLKKDSIYTMKLTRRGVDLSRGMEVTIMQTTQVRDVMSQDMVVFNERTSFGELLKKVLRANESYYYVADNEGKYQGSFTVHDVKEVMNETFLAGLVVAMDLVSISARSSIQQNDTLANCMRKFGVYEMEELPVIDSDQSQKLIGRVSRRDIINIYNREILKQGALGLKFVQNKPTDQSPSPGYVDLPEGFEINIIPPTRSMEGHTIKELDIRAQYGVTVVAINRRGERGGRKAVIPDAEERLKKGDMLVVIGQNEDLTRLKSSLYN